jgi:hypothetical protein
MRDRLNLNRCARIKPIFWHAQRGHGLRRPYKQEKLQAYGWSRLPPARCATIFLAF